jgi:hypothetical protein
MKNQHGLNEKKNLNKEKSYLSIESSEVTQLSLDTNNLSIELKKSREFIRRGF